MGSLQIPTALTEVRQKPHKPWIVLHICIETIPYQKYPIKSKYQLWQNRVNFNVYMDWILASFAVLTLVCLWTSFQKSWWFLCWEYQNILVAFYTSVKVFVYGDPKKQNRNKY